LKRNQLLPSDSGAAENESLTLSEIRTNDPEFRALEQKLEGHWREHEESHAKLRASRYAVGQTLSAIHDKLPHGNWQQWLEEKRIARSTADDIMRDYQRVSELEPSEMILRVSLEKGIEIAEKKFGLALEAHHEELQTVMNPNAAEAVLTQIQEESKRKASSVPFAKRIIKLFDERWKKEGDRDEMLRVLEQIANLVGLAPITLEAYRSAEEVPRKTSTVIEMQRSEVVA
jgi:hypothetical protein